MDNEQHLLDMSFVVTPDHQLEQTLRAAGGRWIVKEARLKQTRGFQFVGNVDRLVSTLLAGCDGQHKLRDLVADLAAGLGTDAERIADACTGAIRTLLGAGFLTVAGDPSAGGQIVTTRAKE